MSNELSNDPVVPTKSPIPITTLKDRGFIKADVAAFDKALPKSNFPWIFENETITYIDRKIVKIEDIDDDSELERFTTQAPRTGPNPQYSAIRSDIVDNGYSLTELPPAVRLVKDGDGLDRLITLDGRTRFEILEQLDIETAVVDIFVMDDGDAIRTAQVYNRYHKPYGEGSTTDIEQCILQLDDLGELDLEFKLKNVYVKDTAKLKERLDNAGRIIKAEAIALSNNKLKPDQLSQIVANVLNYGKTDKTILIRKFNNGARVKHVLKENFKLECTDTVEVYPFSGSELAVGKLIEAIWKRRDWLAENRHRRMDVVLYCGKPNPTDPEGSWRKATVGSFKNEWDKIESYFDYSHKSQVRLIGAIPQIRSLDENFPMDKIHYFK